VATISNLNIDAAADYQSTVTVSSIGSDGTETAFDLTNYTATASLRKNYASSSKTDFTCNIDSPATSGNVTIILTDTQTAALDRGRYVWDMIITSAGGKITRVVEGIVTVNPSVTR
tara:strand:+ start:87 stop:434 length:348 start_codon:yes stop_codon:yes gene_type:complete